MQEIQTIKAGYKGFHDRMIPMMLETPDPNLRERIVETINPIIWQVWHILRAEDMFINTVILKDSNCFMKGTGRNYLK